MSRARATTTRKPRSTRAAEDHVVWTKRQRARLYGSLHPQPNDPVVPTPAAAWSAVRDLYGTPTLYELPKEADRAIEREFADKKILDNVANIAFYGLPLDYLDQYQARVQAGTADQIKAAFARRVVPAKLVTVTVAAD